MADWGQAAWQAAQVMHMLTSGADSAMLGGGFFPSDPLALMIRQREGHILEQIPQPSHLELSKVINPPAMCRDLK
jgi:hypothetical protein